MTSTTADISYLVIDENEESLECGTVFEVLGTTFSTGRVGGNGTHVHLRNCRTDEVCRMWISTFYVGGFRALPLDQVSQDRKDARDFDAATKITDDRTGEIWAVAGTAYGADSKTVAGIRVLDATEDGGAVRVPLAELRSHGTIRAYPVNDFPCCTPAHRHEVAEQCGIADSELPATLPVPADRLLGRAIYLIRELLDPIGENLSVTARARKFLAEVDAS